MGWSLVALGSILLVVTLTQARLSTSSVTGPMVFTLAGVLIGPEVFGVADLSVEDSGIETLLTVTLALVLFVDATHIDLTALRRRWADPVRLLLIAFPLMLVLGFGLGVATLGGLSVFAVAALATILAPTDAALGQAVVTSEQVPLGVRQTLSVESGLNDGLALPILIAVLAVARADNAADPWTVLTDELIVEVGGGLITGLVAGGVFLIALRVARVLDLAPSGAAVAAASLGTLAIAAGGATLIHGSVLIAAFVVGLVLAPGLGRFGEEAFALPEDLVGMTTLLAFVIFGAAIVSPELGNLDVRVAIYAVASLVVLRPIAVALSMWGSGASAPTVLFVGWFGPRGLASILFVAIVVRKSPGFDDLQSVNTVMTWTVMLSIVAHGMTAWPMSQRYGRWSAANPDRTDEGPASRTLPDGALQRPPADTTWW